MSGRRKLTGATVTPTKQQSGRFAIVPARAVDDRRLSKAAFVVLAVFGTYSDKAGWCWPLVATVARRLGISQGRVKTSLRELDKLGYIETIRQYDSRGVEISARRRILFDAGLPNNTDNLFWGGVEKRHPRVSKTTTKGVSENDTHNVPKNAPINIPPNGGENETAATNKLFEDFWRKYPTRRPHSNPKKPALKKFEAALKQGVPANAIIVGAENYSRHATREIDDPKFIAQAQTWLNQERWTEYQEEPAPARPSDDGML